MRLPSLGAAQKPSSQFSLKDSTTRLPKIAAQDGTSLTLLRLTTRQRANLMLLHIHAVTPRV